MDAALLLVLVSAFALLVTAHVALFAALLRRSRPWRSVLALLIPPAAPYLGWGAGLRGWPVTWLIALATYGVALLLALR